MAMDAFDLAERFQTLVFIMSDLDLGMNTWMSPAFTYPDKPIDRADAEAALSRYPHVYQHAADDLVPIWKLRHG